MGLSNPASAASDTPQPISKITKKTAKPAGTIRTREVRAFIVCSLNHLTFDLRVRLQIKSLSGLAGFALALRPRQEDPMA
jgi:hypothetical protein